MRPDARPFSLIVVPALFTAIALVPPTAAQVRATPGRAANPRIAAPQAARAVDMYLKIEGIDGESTDADHKDWIEIESWSWGATNSSSRQPAPVASGRGTLTIVRRVDKASPKLSEACTGGRSLGRVVVHIRTDGGRGYDEYVMEETRAGSCSQSAAGDRPTESIALNFGKVDASPPGGGNPDRPVIIGR